MSGLWKVDGRVKSSDEAPLDCDQCGQEVWGWLNVNGKQICVQCFDDLDRWHLAERAVDEAWERSNYGR